MGFSKYNKDRPFLVITQHFTPADGEKTSTKDWGKTGAKKLQEMVSVVDSVKNKHLNEATVIIDILQRRVVKSRFSEPNEEVITHYLAQYKNQVAEGIQIWMKGQYNDEDGAKTFMNDLKNEITNLDALNAIKLDVATTEENNEK